MAVGQFDYYLPKPSAPPDEGFHSIVEGFLADWAKLHGRGFTPIVIVGDPTSTRVHELRDLLTRNGLLHRIHPPDSPEGVALLERAGISPDGRLAVFVLDGPPLIDPSIADVADALGVNATALQDEFDVVVVGAGPAGLGAAVYGASEGLRTLVVEREALGGQAGNVLADPQLPGLPDRGERQRARRPRLRAGLALRRDVPLHARGHRSPSRRGASPRSCCPTGPRSPPGRSSSPPGPGIESSASRPSTPSPAPASSTEQPSPKRQRSPGRESSSPAAATPPGKPPSTSPSTRARSRSWCAARSSPRACPST